MQYKKLFTTLVARLRARWEAWRNRPKPLVEAIDDDTVGRDEKFALYLAMFPSALQVGIWYLLALPDGIAPPNWVLSFLQYVAIGVGFAAGLALDYVVVTTTMGRRRGRSSVWSWLTMVAASSFAAAIGYELYSPTDTFGPGLHMAYAVVVFLFSAHLAGGRKRLLDPLVATLRADLAAARDALAALETDLRAQLDAARGIVAITENEVATLRETSADQSRELEEVRAHLAFSQTDAAILRSDSATLRETVATFEADVATLRETSAEQLQELEKLREWTARLNSKAAEQLRDLETVRAESGELRGVIATLETDRAQRREHENRLRAELDQLQATVAAFVPTRSRMLDYAREQLNNGATQVEVARTLEIPETTLRGWLKERIEA